MTSDRIKHETQGWAILFTHATRARHAWDSVIDEAEWMREAGLPLERILDALKVSRATYYRQVAELQERRNDTRADSERRDREDGKTTRRLFGATPLLHYIANHANHGAAVCKLHPDDAPDDDTFTNDYQPATCPACNDYTREWGNR